MTSLLMSVYQRIINFLFRNEPDPLSTQFKDHMELSPDFSIERFEDAERISRLEGKFILLYVHCGIHQDTDRFCKDTLFNERIKDFLSHNFVLYGCDANSHAGLEYATRLKITTYPFISILCNVSGSNMFISYLQSMGYDARRLKPSINNLHTIEGYHTADELLQILHTVIEKHSVILEASLRELEDVKSRQSLIEEQNAAFQASLIADMERERKKAERERMIREQQEEEERIQREREEKLEMKLRQKENLAKTLPEEPPKGEDVETIVIRLSDGTRRRRRFYKTDSLKLLFNYVETQEEVLDYKLVTQFPKSEITEEGTIADVFEQKSAVIFVEEIVPEDEKVIS